MVRTDPKNMKTSPEGRVAIAASEGVVPAVYLDSVGVETWGIGVTKWAVGQDQFDGLPVAMPANVDAVVGEAIRLFGRVLVQYEDAVRNAVTVPLHQHEFDALVHFTYNVGGPNFQKSRLLRNLNAGDYEAAGKTGFHGWLKPPELRGRRDHESNMFLTGDYGSGPVPVYKTNGAKRLNGRLKTISRFELLSEINGQVVRPVAQPQPLLPEPERIAPMIESTTITAQIKQWVASLAPMGYGVWSALQEQDQMTKAIILGGLALATLYILHLGRHIIKERLAKWAKGVR